MVSKTPRPALPLLTPKGWDQAGAGARAVEGGGGLPTGGLNAGEA